MKTETKRKSAKPICDIELRHDAKAKKWWFSKPLRGERIIVMETGSSVQVLKALRKWKLPFPKIMEGKGCWDKNYLVKWTAS